MAAELRQDAAKVPLIKDQHPVGELAFGGEHKALRERVARGHRSGIFTTVTPSTASNAAVPARSRIM